MEELRIDTALNVLFKGIEMVADRQKNNASSQHLSQVASFFKHWVLGISVTPQEAPSVEATMDVCELENRILYSGSPLPVEMVMGEVNPEVADVSDAGLHAETLAESPFEIQTDVFELDGLNELGFVDEIENLDLLSNSNRVEEIIFIDSGVESYEVMLHDLQSQLGDSDTAEIVVLDDVDGIRKITETLHQHQDLKAIHLVAHGTTGAIELGNTVLSNENIAGYAGEIASWKIALSESADILFYGCEIGNGPEGLEFLEAMTELTDAEVAGSNNLTGHASWMGDWELEISTGVIESELVFSESFQKSWTYALALSDMITADEPASEALSNETAMSSSASSEDVVNEDVVTEFQSELRLQEGATVTLGASNFTLNGNVPDANSQYIVNNVLGGHFAFATEPDLAVANFTQQEVNEGSVIFVDDPNDLAPSYDISILNPDDSSIITTSASIFLLPVNDPAVISLSMTEFSLNQNSAPIAINGITISDSDGGTGMIEVSVSVESGILDLDPVFGASVHANGDSSLTISGEIDAVGKSLRNLTYQPNTDFSGVDVLQFVLTDAGADSSDSDTPQITTATLDVQATGTSGGEGDDFSIVAPGEITIDGEGTERRAIIDLHHLFECIGNPVEHPNPDWEVVEVTDISLFRNIAVTSQDTLRMVARASVEGLAFVTVQVSYPDGTVGEAILRVNVESSSGEVLEDPREFNWMERLLPKGADNDSDVLFVNSSACSEMSLVITDTTTADNPEDESDSPDGSRVGAQGGEGNQALVEPAPAPISELIRSASDARWMGPRELGTASQLSEMILAVQDFDFSSDFDYQDPSADADISQFRFQTQIKNSNLSSLTEMPFSEVLEANSPLAFAALDEYSEQLNQTANHFGVAVAGSLISLSGLSIGVVTWVARNSAIVTSLMANMPTWQLIDPLMVLGGDDELNAGESVIDIISAGETSDEASQVGRPG